jgi:alkanesulfonate monooxygenase SsuD/methylene tetrahydromethanopterin reductase-like flavin-dependent oxidoreductase (luciferase family)
MNVGPGEGGDEIMVDILFGLDVPPSAAPGSDPVAEARRAEDLGFDFISTSDHPCGDQPTYENWTMLSWIAANTSRIRVANRVLGVPYRPPAMVAKMAETFNRLSGGRLILGLGGGASDDEFRAFGLTVPSPRDKVDGLDEAIRIIRGLWTEPSFTFQGRLFHTDAAEITPKAGGHIPIWTGSFGKRSLAVTGRLADGWIPSYGMLMPEDIPAVRGQILTAAREAGREPEAITCAYNLEVSVDDSTDPEIVSGSVDAVAEQLIGIIKLGMTAFNFKPVGGDRGEQVERLARQVIPAVRAGF